MWKVELIYFNYSRSAQHCESMCDINRQQIKFNQNILEILLGKIKK